MANTTATTRFAWDETIKADKTEVRAPHIIELGEACDDLDQLLIRLRQLLLAVKRSRCRF